MSRNVMSQNLFCKTNKAFRLYLTKYFVSDLNPNNRIRVTRFQQPGTRFLNRVISQLTNMQPTMTLFVCHCCYTVDRFRRPQGLPECVANIVQQECGEEIANEFRSLGQQVLAEAGCPAHKRT